MTKLNVEHDFAEFADNLEPVTLRRRGSTQQIIVETAYRHQGVTQEMEPTGGAVLQTDAVWHLRFPTGEVAPQLGDVVIDQHENRWTILQTEELSQLGRWKCAARELRIAYGCHDRVDIERAVWGDQGNGPEIIDWSYVCMALPVKIQLDEMILDTSTTPPTKQLLFDVFLSESIALEPDDRLTAEDGTSYRLQSLQQAERIDALSIARAVREEVA